MELVTKSEIIDFCVRLYEPEYEEIKDNIKKASKIITEHFNW